LRTQMQASCQAKSIDQQRLLRNAWTVWNDGLRSQVVSSKVDDRILVQALYKWVLEERLLLFRRVIDYRLKEGVLRSLNSTMVNMQFRLDEAYEMSQRNADRRLMQSAMLRFHTRTRIDERAQHTAREFRNSRDLNRILAVWKEKSTHARQLNRWASNFRFFCLTKAVIKRWQEATINVKRVRRREAYATVRRQGKMALARKCLISWQQKTHRLAEIEVEGQRRYQHRLSQLATAAMATLRDQFGHCLEISGQADAFGARRRCESVLSSLRDRHQQLLVLQHTAGVQAADSAERAGVKTFKKLGDTLFLLRRQEDTATAWSDRKFNQHRRNMLRYWAYQTSERRVARDIGDPDSPTKRDGNLFSSLHLPSARKVNTGHIDLEESVSGLGATQRVEDFTLFDFANEPLPTLHEDLASGQSQRQGEPVQYFATPLPGYLRTPSKRTARTKARFKGVPLHAYLPTASAQSSRTVRHFDEPNFGSSVISSTTPAPLNAGLDDMEALTPQVTPFQRKMRAGGYPGSAIESTTPATGGRFVGSRFGRSVRFGDTALPGQRAYEETAHEKSS